MSGANTLAVALFVGDAEAVKAVTDPTHLQRLADQLRVAAPRLWHECMRRPEVRAALRDRRRSGGA